MPSERVTLKQIAEKTGVHATTVSMALRNHPRIPETTRNRLKKIAEEMGYVPDPMLSSLNSYRHNKARKKFLGKIAWLNISADPNWARSKAFIRDYYDGASTRAKSLGYELEVFHAHPTSIPTLRLQQILLSRSIQGLMIAPVQGGLADEVRTIDIDWDKFCSITFGYTLESPEINRVTTNHYHAVTEALRNLQKLGYRRPGIFLYRPNNARIRRLWEAGYIIGMRTMLKTTALPVCLFDSFENRANEFKAWYDACRPDVIIAQDHESIKPIREAGHVRIPEDCGLVLLEANEQGFPCIDQKNTEIGSTATNLLVGALQRNEFCLPTTPIVTMVEGFWNAGQMTMKPPQSKT